MNVVIPGRLRQGSIGRQMSAEAALRKNRLSRFFLNRGALAAALAYEALKSFTFDSPYAPHPEGARQFPKLQQPIERDRTDPQMFSRLADGEHRMLFRRHE